MVILKGQYKKIQDGIYEVMCTNVIPTEVELVDERVVECFLVKAEYEEKEDKYRVLYKKYITH